MIRFPTGENLLVDAGNIVAGVKIVEELKRQGISQLELLVLTHPHPDHMGGAFAVAESFPVKEIWENGEELTEVAKHEDLYRWYLDYFRIARRAKTVSAGVTRKFGRATVQVISPAQARAFADWNANSIVLLISFGDFRLLLAGDANHLAEAALIRAQIQLNATVLKVGHHGADDASGPQLLALVQPKLAVISVNRKNIRGYPGAATRKRLGSIGAEVLRTDECGTIRVIGFPNGKYKIDTDL